VYIANLLEKKANNLFIRFAYNINKQIHLQKEKGDQNAKGG
jgi:hypothetical protein